MTYAFEFIFLIHQRLSAVQIMQLRNSYFHFPYELFFPPSQSAPFKFSVKRRKLKTDANRFADKKRLAKPFCKSADYAGVQYDLNFFWLYNPKGSAEGGLTADFFIAFYSFSDIIGAKNMERWWLSDDSETVSIFIRNKFPLRSWGFVTRKPGLRNEKAGAS